MRKHNKIFAASFIECDTTVLLCGARTEKKCIELAKRVCKKHKMKYSSIEIEEIPFDNTVGYHDVNEFYTE